MSPGVRPPKNQGIDVMRSFADIAAVLAAADAARCAAKHQSRNRVLAHGD